MSDNDLNKIQQSVKELQGQNAIDFQHWKKLGKDIEKLSEKIKLSDTNLKLLMKKIKNDYENLKKIIIDENIQVQLNNKIEENKNEIVDTKNKIDYTKIKAEENSNKIEENINKIEENKNEINKKVNIETFQNSIDEFNSELSIKANKNEVGTPLVANDISEMLDTSKVYVNTTDRNWYSYNGNEWVIGGVYNSQGIGYKSIDSDKTTFLSSITNLFDKSKITNGYVYNWQANNKMSKIAQDNCYIAEKIKLNKNCKYYVFGTRGFFSYLISLDETRKIKSLIDTDKLFEGAVEPTEDCYLYVSYYSEIPADKQYITNTDYKTDYIAYGDNKNITLYGININNMNEDLKLLKSNVVNKLIVKKDGAGDFTTIKDCIDSITDASENNKYQVYVYSGTYDLVEEFGGLEWVKSVVTANKERQGLVLPDFVDLIGVGNVHIKCEVEDENATQAFTTCVSTINIWKNNELKNIKFTAKNTRYVCHDETNNKFNYLNRKVENCQFIHYGNKDGLWSSDKAYASGTGSGGIYEFINCIFEAKKDAPFTFHNNENQEGNTIIIDGCKFLSNGHPYCIGFGYYKKNNINNINRVFIKNSNLDNFIWVHPEVTSVESTNVFEINNFTSTQVKVN